MAATALILVLLFCFLHNVIAIEDDSMLLLFINIIISIIFTNLDCVPRDCKDILQQSQLQKKSVCSGIYTIKPDNKPPFKVYKMNLFRYSKVFINLGLL